MALEQGSIVWARVADPEGRNHKSRPLVIVTKTEQITPAESVQAVAITTRVDEPLPANHVRIPWHRNGHPRTKLRKPSVAVCDWIVEIDPTDVEAIGGRLPAKQLHEVLVRLVSRSREVESTEGPVDDAPREES